MLAVALAVLTLASQSPDSLRAALDARIRAVPGAVVAVSYLDLTTGDTLHLNADDSFHAASTMKVPVMVEMFRQVDRKELALDRRMTLKNEFHSIVDGSVYQLDSGSDSDSSVYTWVGQGVPLRDLLERMIVRSSNLATNALIEIVDARKADATAHALGARNIRVLRGVEDGKAFAKGLNNTTTSRDLAMIFAAIAKHRAASPASCDSMIAILSRQEFNDEIPAGLPAGTRVAHKTGSITAVMHDAAIVYPAAGRPYVLVVLTRGVQDEKVSKALIADLSRIVYQRTGRGS